MTKDLARRTLPRLSTHETVALLVAAGGPLLAKKIMVRRLWIVALLQATGTERAGMAILQAIRARYGSGPVLMRLPFRSFAIILSPIMFAAYSTGHPNRSRATVSKSMRRSRTSNRGAR